MKRTCICCGKRKPEHQGVLGLDSGKWLCFECWLGFTFQLYFGHMNVPEDEKTLYLDVLQRIRELGLKPSEVLTRADVEVRPRVCEKCKSILVMVDGIQTCIFPERDAAIEAFVAIGQE